MIYMTSSKLGNLHIFFVSDIVSSWHQVRNESATETNLWIELIHFLCKRYIIIVIIIIIIIDELYWI